MLVLAWQNSPILPTFHFNIHYSRKIYVWMTRECGAWVQLKGHYFGLWRVGLFWATALHSSLQGLVGTRWCSCSCTNPASKGQLLKSYRCIFYLLFIVFTGRKGDNCRHRSVTGKLGRLLSCASNVRELTSLCSCWGKLVLKKRFRTSEVQLFESMWWLSSSWLSSLFS